MGDSLSASFLPLGSESRRTVIAQRRSINATIPATRALSPKGNAESDSSSRALVGRALASSRMRRLTCALDRTAPTANCSQSRACNSLNFYVLPIFIAIFGVSVGYTAVESAPDSGARTADFPEYSSMKF